MQSIEMCINYNYLLFGSLTKNEGGRVRTHFSDKSNKCCYFKGSFTNHVDLPERGKGGGGNSITLIE